MKKIVLYNPAVSTLNKGDEIISDSVKSEIYRLFPDAFYTEISTHLPVSNRFLYYVKNSDLKFVCGTNLLKAHMLFGFRQWNIHLANVPFLCPAVLFGCGWWQYGRYVDMYSRVLLKTVLSSEYTHSVRDNYTMEKLKKLGIHKVINTGCPTMWRFRPEFCAQIPSMRAENVITTLTDYKKDPCFDRKLLEILSEQYEMVYFWLQGWGDYDYFQSLHMEHLKNIKLVPPDLKKYDILLEKENVEYIGTRLHGGIRALQHKRRSLVIAVDNRALEKQKDFNLPVLPREQVEELTHWISMDRPIRIRLNQENIDQFLRQFETV